MAGSAVNPLGSDRPFDAVTDLLIPTCILGMVGSFTNFIIDVRAAHVGDLGVQVLRNVCLWFLLAVVCISRLLKKYGGREVAGPYIISLAGAMALFLGRFSAASGSNLVMNYILFAGIWWAIHKLTDECTVEENAADEGEAGILASFFSRIRKQDSDATHFDTRARRRYPGRSVILFGLFGIAVFGALQGSLKSPESQQHAFMLMVSTCFFALALLALTSLSGLRMYVHRRGAIMPAGIPRAWVTSSLILVLLLLFVTVWIPRGSGSAADLAERWFKQRGAPTESQYAREGWVEGFRKPIDPSRISERKGDTEVKKSAAGQGKGQPAGAQIDTRPDKKKGEGQKIDGSFSKGAASKSEGGSSGKGATTKERGQDAKGEGGKGGAQGSTESRKTRSSSGGGAGANESDRARGASAGSKADVRSGLGIGGGFSLWWLLLLLILTYMLYRWFKTNRYRIQAWLAEGNRFPALIAQAFRQLMDRLSLMWQRLLAFLRISSPTGKSVRVTKKRKRTNPFADASLLDSMSPEERVRYTYRGILEYAEWIGCARKQDETPIEYLRHLPPPLQPRRQEISLVTGLYIEAAYTPNDLPDDRLAELKHVWDTLRSDVAAALMPHKK